MKSTSPPTAVYATPVATPGSEVRLRTSPEKGRGPSHSRGRVGDLELLGASLRDLGRRLAADVGDAALEVADAGLARVLADDRAQRLVDERQLALLQAVQAKLLRQQVALRDAELLVLRVARELDHVHAVEQRAGDRVEGVRGGDEVQVR